MKYLVLMLGLLISPWLRAQNQVVFQPITSDVYDFVDELANMGIVEINTAVKPWPRHWIAQRLQQAKEREDELTKRQQKDLDFYLEDFGKELNEGKDWERRLDGYYHNSEDFTLTVNPILGGNLFLNDSGSVYHRWGGAEAWAYVGKGLAFQASLRDNGVNEVLAEHNYLTPMQGGNYKLNQNGVAGGRSDWSEMKGAITYGWKWGSVGLVKDDFTWGNNYNGANIFSARNPSFARLNLKIHPVEWFDFNYQHGWLISEVLDSSRTYLTPQGTRQVFHDKYIASNLFTFTPWKKINLSLGNSVIYGDVGINPAYLIPVMFFKSIDHTYNGTGSNDLGQNAQMFFDVSIRRLKNFHFYTTVFLDELSISNMWDPDRHTNLYSAKLGVRATNLLPNTAFTFEYTRTNPWAYQHNIEVTTFASNQFNLGHYLQDNAEEIFTSIRFKPLRGLSADLSYSRALKGPEVDYQLINGVPNVIGLDWLEAVNWSNTTIAMRLQYQVINDGYIRLHVQQSNIQGEPSYTPAYFRGKQTTIMLGMNYGF